MFNCLDLTFSLGKARYIIHAILNHVSIAEIPTTAAEVATIGVVIGVVATEDLVATIAIARVVVVVVVVDSIRLPSKILASDCSKNHVHKSYTL